MIAKLLFCRITRIGKAGVPYVNPGINDRYFDFRAGVCRTAASLPCLDGMDQPEVWVFNCRMVMRFVLSVFHKRTRPDHLQRGAIQDYRDGVEGNVKLAVNGGFWRDSGEPLFELVSKCIKLSAVGFHRSAIEIDF